MMLDFLLGRGSNVYTVVIVLEFILAVYSVSLTFCTEKKIFKIVNILLAIFWAVLALINMFV